MTFVDRLKNLTKEAVNTEHSVSASEMTQLLCNLISEISLESWEDDVIFGEWVEEVLQARCSHTGEHEWILDHCGYWGHQYCIYCQERKYPEIPESCHSARDFIGDITEEQYLSNILDE